MLDQLSPYESLRQALQPSLVAPWARALCDLAQQRLERSEHGDLPRWQNSLAALREVEFHTMLDKSAPELGLDEKDKAQLIETLKAFHPWRKGPLNLGGVEIDTEWRSDWKWDRIKNHVDLKGHTILDVGCGNGYFGWRMLTDHARVVVGIDPTMLFVMQWLVCRHFAGPLHNYVLPLGIEDLPEELTGFDTVFSMGVLYHRRSPIDHLLQLKSLLRPKGQLVLETLVIEGGIDQVLMPKGRYAKMRNVWFIPSTDQLQLWMGRAGFKKVQLLDVTTTTIEEQRSTEWMQFESLPDFLDPDHREKTIEGYPAPTRAMLKAEI